MAEPCRGLNDRRSQIYNTDSDDVAQDETCHRAQVWGMEKACMIDGAQRGCRLDVDSDSPLRAVLTGESVH